MPEFTQPVPVMIDKLNYKRPRLEELDDMAVMRYDNVGQTHPSQRIHINHITRNAESNGYAINSLFKYTEHRQNSRRTFYITNLSNVIIGTDENGYVEHIQTNPKYFRNWHAYKHLMYSLDQPGLPHDGFWEPTQDGLLESFKIQRIDYAINVEESYEQVRSNTHIKYKQNAAVYAETSNRENATYYGTHPSVVVIYDERLSPLRNQSSDNDDNTPLTKLERQERKPVRLRKLAGYQRDLKFEDLPYHFRDIIDGRVDPMKHFRRMDIRILGHDELNNNAQRRNAAYLNGALTFASYSSVRRRLNYNNNFDRNYGRVIETSELPEEDQPTQILRDNIAVFMGFEYDYY